ncbi:unnamed protein product [Paramecium octaurelia]|uniref:Transmembrane protein n=1 Tax=Paramecium octaurelia TaxID=43137 RepID=A0A8S1XPA5_PAROT|nr:unnamed protein product [Paramecium octaurelia]
MVSRDNERYYRSEIIKKILNIIKKALDQENYIKIYQANHYEIHEEIKLLEQEIKDLKEQILLLSKKREVCTDQFEQLEQKEKELQDLNKQRLLSKKITQIKEDVLGKCKIILERKKNALQGKSDLNQKNKLNLSEEENQLLYKILEHRDKFYKHLLNNITNEFIAQMLFDNSMSINDKVSLLYKIDNVNLERIQDIPEELMSQKTQDQIYKLDRFNNNIKEHDENKDPTKVDFKEFKKKFTFICAAFTNEASIHHELQEFLTYKWKQIDQFYKIPLSIPNILITIPCALIMAISAGSELFKKSLFVQKMEKEKQEKLIQAQIQQKYFKEFEKKNR